MPSRRPQPQPPLEHQLEQIASGMSRRQFARLVTGLGALGMLEPQFVTRALADGNKRLSTLAYRSASQEGLWSLTDIEGEVPPDLHGTLYRVAPGQSENHGVQLKHFFDGDAFLSGFSFRDGKVTLRSRFLETPERKAELEAGKMLYAEFGTLAPEGQGLVEGGRLQFKNQPNVNVIHYDGRLLALSEGGHPSAADPAGLGFQERWNFHGTLPPYIPFTAHPKVDPKTGEAYGYGVAQGPGMALTVFRMEPDGKLHQLHSVPLGGYYMIHDMLLTKQHLVFVIPPVRFDFALLFGGKGSVADALQYLESESTRFLVVRRDGQGEPVFVEQPANMVFHNGNAFERADGTLVLDTFLSPGEGVLELLYAHTRDVLPDVPPPRFTRLELDLAARKVKSRTEFAEDQEFPRFDIRRIGEESRYLYTMESEPDDPYVGTRLVRHDLARTEQKKVSSGPRRALGETVFVPRSADGPEDDGWLLLQGFDAERDENFVEIRDAGTLDLAARVWNGVRFPLGFHGNFVEGVFVG